MKIMIYFDNAATTQTQPEVIKTYTEVATKIWGNPSSLHNLGTQATRILEASRRQIAELLGKESKEIFFTSGGTEGDNWVIKGVAFEKAHLGKHIIVSAIEHPAVKESALWLKTQGFEVDLAPVNTQGFVDVSALETLIRPDTTLVSVMAVNNEIGAIQPIQEISQLLADKPTISFHVDAVQAIGKVPTEQYLTDRVDFASFSGHKFHSVRGVGFVDINAGAALSSRAFISSATWRTPGSPIKAANLLVKGQAADGTMYTASLGADGAITGLLGTGSADVSSGLVTMQFPRPIAANSLVYSTVILTSIPLDSDAIGLDPVRLPPDGKVPIFSVGVGVVVHGAGKDDGHFVSGIG
jgi:selenocysteine lyase/cysteine desulfurase